MVLEVPLAREGRHLSDELPLVGIREHSSSDLERLKAGAEVAIGGPGQVQDEGFELLVPDILEGAVFETRAIPEEIKGVVPLPDAGHAQSGTADREDLLGVSDKRLDAEPTIGIEMLPGFEAAVPILVDTGGIILSHFNTIER